MEHISARPPRATCPRHPLGLTERVIQQPFGHFSWSLGKHREEPKSLQLESVPTPPGKPRIHAHVHMHTPAHSMLEGQKQETHGPLPSGRGGEWWSWTDLLVPKLTHCLRRGCYKKYTTVASTTSIYFSEFWRFCRPECQQVWALREDPFPVYRWPLSFCVLT